jgi:hypothetical protein
MGFRADQKARLELVLGMLVVPPLASLETLQVMSKPHQSHPVPHQRLQHQDYQTIQMKRLMALTEIRHQRSLSRRSVFKAMLEIHQFRN